jgi:hypothetical protein
MNTKLHLIPTANQFGDWLQPDEKLGGKSLMIHLYNRLDGAYPHKWRSNFLSPEALDNWACSWAEAFEEEGITPRDIKAGLKACRAKHDWPPSCSEFIKACRPALNSVNAYYEALEGLLARDKGEVGVWSHPAVFWASSALSFDLKNKTFSQVKSRWEKALDDEMKKGDWEEIPKPMIAIENKKTDFSKEKAEQFLRSSSMSRVSTDRTDLDWAKNILKNVKNKTRVYPNIAIKFAKEALKEFSS